MPVLGWQREGDPEGVGTYRGLSVRISGGLGYASMRRDVPAGRDRTSGLSGLLALEVGGATGDNLIVFGRLSGFALNHASSNDSPNAGSAYVAMLGGGVRYHLMPNDWYGSANLGLALLSVTRDLGQVENAQPGLGMELELGKNWWAGTPLESRTVGLGLRVGYVRCGSVGASGAGAWSGFSLGLVLSTGLH